jgi:hypothetical protein
MPRRSAETWGGYLFVLSVLLICGGGYFCVFLCWGRAETGDPSITEWLPIPFAVTVCGAVLCALSYRVK